MKYITVDQIQIRVTKKSIRNINLYVCPATGDVRISAPSNTSIERIKGFALSRIGWIKKHLSKYQGRIIPEVKDCINNESHYFLGKEYTLKLIETDTRPKIELNESRIIHMYSRPGDASEKRRQLMNLWYRQELKKQILPLVEKWESKTGLNMTEWKIRRMKTKWGSVSLRTKTARLNLELIKKPVECLEYVIVHELVHLVERYHNLRFRNYMENYLPGWERLKEVLNSPPYIS